MEPNLIFKTAHVVDILGNVIGRDQQIMTLEKAHDLVSLLHKNDFIDEKVVFFDPFCKAGEVLLACAFTSCWHKSSLEGKPLALNQIKKELYESNRYFGLSPDERHHKLSLRTFLGNTNSHSDKYNQIIRNGNYLSEIDGRLDRDKFKEELYNMLKYINSSSKPKKIVAVGNPPYQENDGGAGGSAKQIYNFFVETLMSSNVVDEFVLVIPARWFSAGKGLDAFRKKIMECNQVKSITYFEKAEEIFPTVQIKGGLCFLHWSSTYNESKPDFISGSETNHLNLAQYDIIPDDPKAATILNKIIERTPAASFISSIALPRKTFGLGTSYFQKNDSAVENSLSAIKCYTTGRKIKHINRKLITKNLDKIDSFKVVVPKAYGKGMSRCTLPKQQIFIIEKGEICTETYNIIGCYDSRQTAENLQTYLQTDFSRYLLGLRKITQDIPRDRWSWVPFVDVSKKWTDAELFALFNLTKEEQAHIKKKVEEWS